MVTVYFKEHEIGTLIPDLIATMQIAGLTVYGKGLFPSPWSRYTIGVMNALHYGLRRGLGGLPAVAMAVGLSGCFTTGHQQATRDARRQEDQRLAQEQQARLMGRLESLELALESLEQEQRRAHAQQAAEMATRSRSWEEERQRQEVRLRALEEARIQDRREIIEQVSARVHELLRAQRPAAAARPRGGRSEYGYEHEIRPGETLSQIAAAYGTSVQAIMEANSIRDAHRVRAGQVVFIPE